MGHTLVSTTFTVEGYRVVRQLGLAGELRRNRPSTDRWSQH
jgi:hypothetical protein